MRPTGLSESERKILLAFSRKEKLISKDLFSLTGLARSTMSRGLSRLEAYGLIESKSIPRDEGISGMMLQYSLTKSGKETLKQYEFAISQQAEAQEHEAIVTAMPPEAPETPVATTSVETQDNVNEKPEPVSLRSLLLAFADALILVADKLEQPHG